MADTKSEFKDNANVNHSTFPFLDLPLDIRCLIYHEVFSLRGIILRNHVNAPDGPGPHEGQVWEFHLEEPDFIDMSVISLLQTSKQILREAKSLLSRYPPSHLIFGRDLRRLPTHYQHTDLEDIGLLHYNITHLTINARHLGSNQPPRSHCPHPIDLGPLFYRYRRVSRGVFRSFPSVKRLPNLRGIHIYSLLFSKMLPALREIHIHDVLERSLRGKTETCRCPIAGVSSCTCGKCTCTCVAYPKLPHSTTMSLTDTESQLRANLISQYRSALPPKINQKPATHCFDDYIMLNLLARGTHIFLHDEVNMNIPLAAGAFLHKGTWHVTYHLAPDEDFKNPIQQLIESTETISSEPGRNQELPIDRPIDTIVSLPNFLHLAPRYPQHGPKISAFLARSLLTFETDLQLKIADESMFDKILMEGEIDEETPWPVRKGGRWWLWN